MGRIPRETLQGGYYHCINRGVGRREIFHDNLDYKIFIHLMRRSQKKYSVDILSYCLMPNHWHMVLSTNSGKQLSQFFSSLLNSHTKSYHARYKTIGHGPIYQGRFKSIVIPEEDVHAVCRYVERNPIVANLVDKAHEWNWSSFKYWVEGADASGLTLKRPFVEDCEHWAALVNSATC